MPSLNRPWRSLAELERDPAFLARAAEEFPGLAAALAAPADRRRVLKLMAASIALAGLAGCDPAGAEKQIVPAVNQPPQIVPGLPNHYATASTALGSAIGIVVTHRMGRPFKVEGNPRHPASLGATDTFAQALVLDFYDPDRSAGIVRRGEPSDRPSLLAALAERRSRFSATHGAGLRILTTGIVSPSLGARLQALLKQYPAAQWHQWDGMPRDAPRRAAILAYGRPVEIVPRIGAADVVLALESDLLSSAPGYLAHARAFAERRNPARTARMSRIYAAEATPTLIGAVADHRLPAHPERLHALVQALAATVLGQTPPQGEFAPLIADLTGAHGRAYVHAGPDLPAETIALCHAINEALGGRGHTFEVVEPVEHAPTDQTGSLRALAAEMHAGAVESLVVLGGNPVFTAPASFGFAAGLARVPFVLASSQTWDETAAAATWFVPQAHDWEAWGDARAFDGTATIMQPQALPLYDGWSPFALLALLGAAQSEASRDAVRATWRDALDEAGWHAALAAGVVPNTASARADVALRPEAGRLQPPPPPRGLTLLLRPDPQLWDGRFANNPWLQEMPRPLTKLSWDNPLLISPDLARREGLANGAEVRLRVGEAEVTLPVYLAPGQAPDVIVGLLGYGRQVVGSVGAGTGFDLFTLRGASGPLSLAPTGRQVALASTDHHDPLEADPGEIIRRLTLAAFGGTHAEHDEAPTLYRRPAGGRLDGPAQWGMSVDLNACIGCNACVIACQAENNVPVVGKEQVIAEREMYWLRIDRYYVGDAADPEMLFQPMLCQHCEEAPCEIVCPVFATVHDSEGLNLQVYNRCVGTRFCSNNCPYKVRRFNFGAFAREEPRMPISRNPEVTVRARGVMEKCTFCLQRIAAARIAADIENRPIRGDEVRTACQQACPTRAISFGNLVDPAAEVVARKQSPLSYAALADRATHPRLTYETLVRNPNPAMGRTA
jgi:molybdopterin-containing oxidoreductase family iron-sulfur binding subunit